MPDRSTPAAPRRLAVRLLSMLLGACVLGCGAPSSEPASGEVGEAVRKAMDSGTARFDHGAWDDLLGASVRGELVDYRIMAQRRPELDNYLVEIAEVRLDRLAPGELEALLLNAYNALTVASILDHPGISSIREIDGVWDRRRHRVGGFDLTLDEIEHNLLRPYFRDPRIHFAVNCASRSCAALPAWAFAAPDLETQLDERARVFLSDSRHVRIDGDTLWLSRYFDWYGDDFTASGWSPRADSIPDFVAKYTTDTVRRRLAAGPPLAIEFLDYDWSLNDASS